MDVPDYRTVILGNSPTEAQVAEFISTIMRMRDVVNLFTLRVDHMGVEPVNAGCDDPEVMNTWPGRRYSGELRGNLKEGTEGHAQSEVWVAATFTVFWRFKGEPAHLQLDELRVGIVPIQDRYSPRALFFDITRVDAATFPAFPAEWRDLVAARCMALMLAAGLAT